MIWDEVHEKFYKIYQASEARKLRVLPGRIRASGALAAVLVEAEHRKDGETSRLFVTTVGTLIGPGLLTEDGLGLTQECDDLFDTLLMHLRRKTDEAQFLSTKAGRTMVAFKPHGRPATRPMLLLPWWAEDEFFQSKDAAA